MDRNPGKAQPARSFPPPLFQRGAQLAYRAHPASQMNIRPGKG
jgi:hypothetical protein